MEQIASQFRGLGDPIRLRILHLLEKGELCVCDLIDVLDLPQSTVSRHLAYLRNSGWVESRRDGKWMHYRRPAMPSPFQGYIFALLGEEFSLTRQASKDSESIMHRLANKDMTTCSNTSC